MIIDCGSCTVRGVACADCVVTFLTIPVRAGDIGSGSPPRPGRHGPDTGTGVGTGAGAETGAGPVYGAGAGAYPPDLDEAERRAIDVLARSGLVPPLRLVRAV